MGRQPPGTVGRKIRRKWRTDGRRHTAFSWSRYQVHEGRSAFSRHRVKSAESRINNQNNGMGCYNNIPFAWTSQLTPPICCCCCCCTGGASAAGAAEFELPPKSMLERPWPMVEPTATEPAVAAIWASMPGCFGWAAACVPIAGVGA